MHRREFTRLLAKSFYPMLRDEGFKGSGTTLRRIRGPLLHVFNLQGSSGGKGFYVNLGAHLEFLGGGDLNNVRESGCAFRCRMDPADNRALRWSYPGNEREAGPAINLLASAWTKSGQAFFTRYAAYPESFEQLLASAESSTMRPTEVLTYARISRQLGHQGRANKMVREALPRVSERATSLIGNMKAFLRDSEEET